MNDPILLTGVSQRCGTNYLEALLLAHPHVVAPRTIRENHLAAGADILVHGIKDIVSRYPRDWIDQHRGRTELARHVGDGLLRWLAADAGVQHDDEHRLVSKSPSAMSLRELLMLTPDAFHLLLVRDGRDVVASGMAGFGWSFDEAVRNWLVGARAVLSVVGRPLPEGTRVRLVRFEDLVEDLEGTLATILRWTGLDLEIYDFEAARHQPVRGSSFVAGARGVRWDPVEAPTGFDPRNRARAWPPELHARFHLRAATELAALGYPVDPLSAHSTYRALGAEAVAKMRRITQRLLRI